jgi:glucose-1-phosphate thymidylyltransferase
MIAGIRDILIISTPKDTALFEELLGDGESLNINIEYKIQESPKGIAEAFILGEKFIDNDQVCLILGDNIFYGHGLPELIKKAFLYGKGATIFGYYVKDPERYGVVTFDGARNAVKLEEKPSNPESNYAIVGLYVYDNRVVEVAQKLQPSVRGELEITDLNKVYLQNKQLRVEILGRGIAWLDTGTHDSMMEASNYIKTIESRQGLKIACIEEIAYNLGYIDRERLLELGKSLQTSSYGQYLIKVAEEY